MEGVAEHRHSRAGMATLAEIQGPGAIQHMWMTIHPDTWRRLVIRIFWAGEEHPSVEVPLGDETGKNRGLRGHRLVILFHVSAKWTR
jgi:hypothetical protein